MTLLARRFDAFPSRPKAKSGVKAKNEECAISSYKEPTVDALAPDADEGRGWLR